MKRLLLAFLVLVAGGGAAVADGVLKVGDQKGGSRALMEAAGVLADVPYTIDWKEFPAAAPLLEALNAGAIETGVVGDAPFTFAAARGIEAKAIAAIRYDPGGLAIVVKKDSQIRSAGDLKGKKIATGKGSIGHQLVLATLEKQGWTVDDVRLVFLAPPDAKIAYSSGAVDAWATWEPYVAQEEVLFGARIVASGIDVTPGLSFQVARNEAVVIKRVLLEDFIERLSRARVWALTHNDGYARTWSKLVGVPVEVSTRWLERAKIRIAPIDASVIEAEQRTIDLYARNSMIGKPIKAGDIVDLSFGTPIERGAKRANRS